MKHIDEEVMIDYALGKVSHEQQASIRKHLFSCEKCNKAVQYWEQLLTDQQIEAVPQTLEHRLTQSIQEIETKKQVKRPKKPVIALTCFAALLTLSFGLHQFFSNETNPIIEQQFYTAQHEEVPKSSFMENPDTNRLDIVPATIDENIESDIWLNEETNEMVLYVDGLQPLQAQDYQLWINYHDDNWYGELLQLRDGVAYVYYQANDIANLKLLKVSIEPQGGSKTPTGPETLYLNLND
ncbi:Putative zinc-finger [Oceanobacillus limi]|uniref:Regulator of SigK n=1 Tax=Oceanobacillus limi TaxID=930131 RepID=A0A1H9YIZ1_9BACI|nr:anti-sigma factor [Oceanobacillus limi]SES68913.1 Putative zinc-finger [Oceanobacillus limi]